MQDGPLVNLLIVVIFVIVWLLMASAARKGQQQRPQRPQTRDPQDQFDIEPLENYQPEPLDQTIQTTPIPPSPSPQPHTFEQAPVVAPVQFVPGIISEEPIAAQRIIVTSESLREAVVLMEILDQPLALRPPGRWWQ